MPDHIIILLLQILQGLPPALKIKTKLSKMATWILQGLASTHLSSFISEQLSSSKMAFFIEPLFGAGTSYAVPVTWNVLPQLQLQPPVGSHAPS